MGHAILAQIAKQALGLFLTLLGGLSGPHEAFLNVLGDYLAIEEDDTIEGLRLGVTLLGGPAQPAHGLSGILLDDTGTIESKKAKRCLSEGIIGIGGGAEETRPSIGA